MNQSSCRPWLVPVVVGLLLLALLVGCSQSPAKTSKPTDTPPTGESALTVEESTPPTGETVSFTTRITQRGFIPSTIRVHQGDRVQLTIFLEYAYWLKHSVYLDGYGLEVILNEETPEQTMEFTADQVGTFAILFISHYCTIHGPQNGQLIVQ